MADNQRHTGDAQRSYQNFMRLFVCSQDGLKFIVVVDRQASGQDLEHVIADAYDNLTSTTFSFRGQDDLRINNHRTKRISHRGYQLNIPQKMTVSHFLDDKDEIECEIEENRHTIEIKIESKAQRKRAQKEQNHQSQQHIIPKKDPPAVPTPDKQVRPHSDPIKVPTPQKKIKTDKPPVPETAEIDQEDDIPFDEPVVIQPTDAPLYDSSLEAHALNNKQKEGKSQQQKPVTNHSISKPENYEAPISKGFKKLQQPVQVAPPKASPQKQVQQQPPPKKAGKAQKLQVTHDADEEINISSAEEVLAARPTKTQPGKKKDLKGDSKYDINLFEGKK